jgi:hypothetical protein
VGNLPARFFTAKRPLVQARGCRWLLGQGSRIPASQAHKTKGFQHLAAASCCKLLIAP